MKFAIKADTIKALLLAAAKNDVRYYLNGILFDVRATDAVAVATDGHVMLAVPITPEPDENDETHYLPGQFIVPRDVLESIKPNKIFPLFFTFDAAARTVTIANAGTETTVKLIDGTYPEWRRAVPKTVTDMVAQFDTEYLATFGKIHKLLGGKYSPTIRHNGDENGGGGAGRVMLAGNAVGVIMPMRHDRQPLANPSWLEYPPTEVAAAA